MVNNSTLGPQNSEPCLTAAKPLSSTFVVFLPTVLMLLIYMTLQKCGVACVGISVPKPRVDGNKLRLFQFRLPDLKKFSPLHVCVYIIWFHYAKALMESLMELLLLKQYINFFKCHVYRDVNVLVRASSICIN